MGTRRLTLSVSEVNLHVEENAKLHHTDKFDLVRRTDGQKLVVRRGQPFKVTLDLERLFHPDKHYVVVLFKTGKAPKLSNGTMVRLEVTTLQDFKSGEWAAWMDSPMPGGDVELNIKAAADAIVAEWVMEFQLHRKRETRPNRKPSVPATFSVNGVYILFNPWCRDDSTYHKDEDKLNEYILNDVGKIWRGIKTSFRGMIWNYGQFEPGMLEASLAVLDKSPRLRFPPRGSPVFVSREISAMINANDGDNGVIEGNWSGEYEDGVSPTEWHGSLQILEQWMKTGEPVKYGQCWNFAGVLTTVMRALGIPCRPITNFDSAHDTDNTITYDVHVDDEGNRVEDLSSDSVWNFHVWNEVWMSRPDLPKGYGGWQIVDSTPQETSDSIYQVGPASVTAVRRGEVGLNYDTAFVFAEVNADKVVWMFHGEDEPLDVLAINTNEIGRSMSTKRPGIALPANHDRRDVTHRYKAPELSKEERMTVMNAVKTGRSPARSIYHTSEHNDVTGDLKVTKIPLIEKDFTVELKITNESSHVRTVEVIFKVDSMLYTGALHKLVKKVLLRQRLAPNEEKIVPVVVRGQEYLDKLIDQASLSACGLLKVEETGQVFPMEYHFRVKLPDIVLQVAEVPIVNQIARVVAELSNPLSVELTNGKFKLEGAGMERSVSVPVPTIAAKAKAQVTFEVMPNRSGDLILVASFCSKELQDVDGSLTIQVLAA